MLSTLIDAKNASLSVLATAVPLPPMMPGLMGETKLLREADALWYGVRAVELIRFKGVKKAFGPKVVYRDLHLAVHEGETLTVIGGSGAGKSVMLRLLIGLLRADGGEIFFRGQELTQLHESEFLPVRRRIAMLFQGAALFDSMSIGQNVAYGLEEAGFDSATIPDRVDAALRAVGLEGQQSADPAGFSSGMRKRAGLARAIAMEPEVILYDEPTTGLDPVNIFRITELITELSERLGVTSIVVTHDMPSAFRISDRIAMVFEGGIIFDGQADALANCDDVRVRDFVLGNAPHEQFEETR